MSKHNDGGPAFPIPIAGCNDGGVYNTMQQSIGQLGGMSLRDYFAAKVAAAIWTNSDLLTQAPKADNGSWIARLAYEQADALIKVGGHED